MNTFKIYAQDSRGKENIAILQQNFGIKTYADLNDTHYIVVNEDVFKLPVMGKITKG